MKIPSSRQRRDWTLDESGPPPEDHHDVEDHDEHEEEAHGEVPHHVTDHGPGMASDGVATQTLLPTESHFDGAAGDVR
jgi:hypothetical protein